MAHLSCDACLAVGCAWCLGNRKCVEDKAWACNGDTDHVGSIGAASHSRLVSFVFGVQYYTPASLHPILIVDLLSLFLMQFTSPNS